MMRLIIIVFGCFVLLVSCKSKTDNVQEIEIPKPKGKLFIIGGGKRPEAMIDRMVKESGVDEGGYGLILPMSSAEPDSAVFYGLIQFQTKGLTNITGLNVTTENVTPADIVRIRNASLIYISGGDQNKFMKLIKGSEIGDAIRKAFENGALIAGTSAGAAVMSEVMITGDERNYSEYSETFENIELDNIIMDKGLGLISTAIIDQHFIKRSRYNRLISAVIENPTLMGIGIDEATAILVSGNQAEVIGESQVVLIRKSSSKYDTLGAKLGASDLSLDLILPGDFFTIQ